MTTIKAVLLAFFLLGCASSLSCNVAGTQVTKNSSHYSSTLAFVNANGYLSGNYQLPNGWTSTSPTTIVIPIHSIVSGTTYQLGCQISDRSGSTFVGTFNVKSVGTTLNFSIAGAPSGSGSSATGITAGTSFSSVGGVPTLSLAGTSASLWSGASASSSSSFSIPFFNQLSSLFNYGQSSSSNIFSWGTTNNYGSGSVPAPATISTTSSSGSGLYGVSIVTSSGTYTDASQLDSYITAGDSVSITKIVNSITSKTTNCNVKYLFLASFIGRLNTAIQIYTAQANAIRTTIGQVQNQINALQAQISALNTQKSSINLTDIQARLTAQLVLVQAAYNQYTNTNKQAYIANQNAIAALIQQISATQAQISIITNYITQVSA